MEQIQRQSSSIFNSYDDTNAQNIQTTIDETNCSSRKTVSRFEDLSNELIYEIFDFLDYFHVYEAFFNLNLRFHSLLVHSNLPVKINLSSISKPAFKRYNTDIIQTSMHRIHSLHFSDVFMYDLVLSSICKLSKFSRVETLILHNIQSVYLDNLLNQLPFLSLLSSLVITTVDTVRNRNTIYRQIFRLPALKYCKLFLEGSTGENILPVSVNEYSSIEHLIINNYIYLSELNSLLSYVPQLRRLSFGSLAESRNAPTQIFPRLLNYLTHVSFNVTSVKFDQLEQLIINTFRTVQVLYFLQHYDIDSAYMNANKWKQLILSHIPNLRIFNIQLDVSASNNDDQLRIEAQINQFTTSFWIERQWFFAHQFYRSRYGNRAILYSSNPYRRKHYTLYKQLDENTSFHHYESNLDSVQHAHIENGQNILNCMNYFPNAVELTFYDDFSAPDASVAIILNRIIRLKQLTKLLIEYDRFSFDKVIEILCGAPNIHTLKLKSMPCCAIDDDYILIEGSKDFQEVSNTNVITNVTCDDECTLEQIELLVALCPRVQYLTINSFIRDIKSITRFLLDKNNQHTRNLYSLCLLKGFDNWFEKLDTLIKSETLLDDYTLKWIGSKLYLWW